MVQYYGRARMRTGSVNRNQGKATGSASSTGSTATIRRNVSRRVNSMARIGCTDANGVATGERQVVNSDGYVTCVANTRFLLIPKAPKSRSSAGGVHVLAGAKRR